MGNSKFHKYKEIKELGEGGFAKVYKVLNNDDHKFYVNKKIPVNKEKQNIIEKEVEFLKKFDNEYIVKYYESFIKDDFYNIIIEYCDNGDLSGFIENYKKKNIFINEKVIYCLVLDICRGIKEIHSQKLIHRDLKPDNIFISKDYKAKIGDFDISKQLINTNDYSKTQKGTLRYMAPEILNGEEYNRKIDIWSLGCILYELFTLKPCFDCPYINGLINQIISGKHGKIDIKKYNSQWQNLIDISLKLDCHERPEIDEILNLIHKIGQQITFSDNKNLQVTKLDEISRNILKNKFNDNHPDIKNNQLKKDIVLKKKDEPILTQDIFNKIISLLTSGYFSDINKYIDKTIGNKINNIIYYEERINNFDLINDISLLEKNTNGAFIFCTNLESLKIITEEILSVFKRDNRIKFNLIIGENNMEKVIDFLEANKDSYKFIENKCLYTNKSLKYNNYETNIPIYKNKNEIINYINEFSTDEIKPYPLETLITFEIYLEIFKKEHFLISQFYGNLNIETFKENYNKNNEYINKNDSENILSLIDDGFITFDIKKDIDTLEKLTIEDYTKNTFYSGLNKWLRSGITSKKIILAFKHWYSRFMYYLNLYAQQNKKFINKEIELYHGCRLPYSILLKYERAKGKIILSTGFKSTSDEKNVAIAFSFRKKSSDLYKNRHLFSVIFIIRNIYKNNLIPNGIEVNYSEFNYEKEVLFQPFSFFYVKEVKIDLSNYTADIYLDTIGKKEILEEQIKYGKNIKYNENEKIMEVY